MATRGANVITLADWAKRLDGEGRITQDIVELLEQSNEIISDMSFQQGNLPTGNRVVMRTGLPTVYWRLYNQGVSVSKSTTAQIDEQCGEMQAWSEVDAALAELGGDVNAFRLSEAVAFIEAMNQEFASTLFYGNSSVSQEEFTGFSIRYSDSTAGNGSNIVKAGGSGNDNTSIWLIGWGNHSVYGMFPKGSKAGLQHTDYGKVVVETPGGSAEGKRMSAYRESWAWNVGLCLKDWRYVVRQPNIDVSDLIAENASAATLIKNMIKMIHRLPKGSQKSTRRVFYMNRTVLEYLDIQSRDAVSTGGQLGYKDVYGEQVLAFRGIPCKCVDALLESEATVA
jgi:hypothetical protein